MTTSVQAINRCLTSLFKGGDTRLMNLTSLRSAQESRPNGRQRLLVVYRAWLRILFLGAQIVVLSFSPASYRPAARRQQILAAIYWATAPHLTAFLTLSALISVVLIRIVVASAQSYGLSQYALGLLVRTLVLELIPLYAAMFVAVRYSLPGAHRMRERLADLPSSAGSAAEQRLLRDELLPRALAAAFSVQLLATLSGLLALVLSYLMVYGLSPWGLSAYTHSVGQVFTLPVSLIFALKTFFFSLAVAIVPMAASVQRDQRGGYRRSSDIFEFARLFSVVLTIEILSLIGNYY